MTYRLCCAIFFHCRVGWELLKKCIAYFRKCRTRCSGFFCRNFDTCCLLMTDVGLWYLCRSAMLSWNREISSLRPKIVSRVYLITSVVGGRYSAHAKRGRVILNVCVAVFCWQSGEFFFFDYLFAFFYGRNIGIVKGGIVLFCKKSRALID